MTRVAGFEARVIGMKGNPTWAQGMEETLLVRIWDEDGLEGIGETMVAPATVKALIDMPTVHAWSHGMQELVLGIDPFEAPALWDRIYEATIYHGRRGIGIHGLSAIDIALYDLSGKQLGRPVYQLLGGPRRQTLRPYATIFPGLPNGRPTSELMAEIARQFDLAIEGGFRAIKMEVLFGHEVDDRTLVDFIREGRSLLASDIIFALDFGYRWRDWQAARWVLNRLEDCDIFFAEAPLQHDDLHGHARLSQHCPIRICGGELATTRWEIRDWIEVAQVSVVQPSISRAGGFTELRRIADMCELYGVQLIPHSWATGITDVCNLHLQTACQNVPLVECRPPQLFPSLLRETLVLPAIPTVSEGKVDLPDAPGLGIELNSDLFRAQDPSATLTCSLSASGGPDLPQQLGDKHFTSF